MTETISSWTGRKASRLRGVAPELTELAVQRRDACPRARTGRRARPTIRALGPPRSARRARRRYFL